MGPKVSYLSDWVTLFRVLVVIYSLHIRTVLAATNVTVDDQDPSIHYAPTNDAWGQTNYTTLDYGGSHKLTSDSYATASFNFTGIAIYFWSPLWPYTVSSAISLDSGPITLVDLVDHSRPVSVNEGPETVQSKIVWSATGLANTQHNLLISVGAGQPYAVVDALTYTIATVDISSSSSSSRSSSKTSSATSSSSSTVSPTLIFASTPIPSSTGNTAPNSKSRSILTITIGSLSGMLGFFVILFLGARYFNRHRKTSASRSPAVEEARYISLPGNSSIVGSDANWAEDQVENKGYDVIQPQYNDGKTLINLRYEIVDSPVSQISSLPGGYQDSISSRMLPGVDGSRASYAEMSIDGRDDDD